MFLGSYMHKYVQLVEIRHAKIKCRLNNEVSTLTLLLELSHLRGLCSGYGHGLVLLLHCGLLSRMLLRRRHCLLLLQQRPLRFRLRLQHLLIRLVQRLLRILLLHLGLVFLYNCQQIF